MVKQCSKGVTVDSIVIGVGSLTTLARGVVREMYVGKDKRHWLKLQPHSMKDVPDKWYVAHGPVQFSLVSIRYRIRSPTWLHLGIVPYIGSKFGYLDSERLAKFSRTN